MRKIGEKVGLVVLLLAITVIAPASYINARDEMPRVDLGFLMLDYQSVRSEIDLASEVNVSTVTLGPMPTVRTFLDASDFYKDLSETCDRLSSIPSADKEFIKGMSDHFVERAEYYSKVHYEQLPRLIRTTLYWSAGPIVLLILYLLSTRMGVTYSAILGMMALYVVSCIYYASNGRTDPNTAAHMHLILVPIMLGFPTTIIAAGTFVAIFKKWRLDRTVMKAEDTD